MNARDRRLELYHSASDAVVESFGLPPALNPAAGFYFHVQLKVFVSAAGTLTIEPRAAWEDGAGDLLRASWVPYTAAGFAPASINAAFLTAHDHQLSFDTCFIYRDYLDPATGAGTDTDQLYTYDLGAHADQVLECRDARTGAVIYQNTNGSPPEEVEFKHPKEGYELTLQVVPIWFSDRVHFLYYVKAKSDPENRLPCVQVGDLFYEVILIFQPILLRLDYVKDCARGEVVENPHPEDFAFADQITLCPCPCPCPGSTARSEPETQCVEVKGEFCNDE